MGPGLSDSRLNSAPQAQTQSPSAAPQTQTAPPAARTQPASAPDDAPPAKPDKNAPSPLDARKISTPSAIAMWVATRAQGTGTRSTSKSPWVSSTRSRSNTASNWSPTRSSRNTSIASARTWCATPTPRCPFTIKVIDTDEINAFALPGGFFYVNSGLILAADNEAELAGVMAHEIAHVAACHVAREQTRSNIVNLASIPLVFVPGGWAVYEATQVAMGIGVPLTFMKFSRNFESEADFLGMEYMYKTGYDPQSFISFFEKIEAQEKKKPGAIAKAFSSHPMTPDRVAAAQKEMATVLPPRDEYIVNTSEFDQVKSRLASIENKHKLQTDKSNADRPTLRRSTADNPTNNNGTGTQNDDDRPTLKRSDGSSSSSSLQ